jgi:MFS family permease
VPLSRSFRALASPNFRRFWLGQMVSMIGTWVQSVAVMWLAYRLSGSTAFTGLVGFLNAAPYLFLSPLAGVLGDRWPRRRILMAVHCLLMTQAVALALLTAFDAMSPPLLAGLALFAGLCNAFETPTRQSIFVQLLEDREDLPNAIALNSMMMNGTRLVGPSIGGLLIASFGETACFAINAVSYVFVLWALLTTTIVHRRTRREPTHPLADLAEGWRYAMGFMPVRRMLFLLAAVSASISPYATLMPAIAVKTFAQGAEVVGLFIGAVGLGAVISAVGLARRPNIRGLARWIGIAAIVGGLGAVGFSFSRTVWLSALLMMLEGWGMFLTAAACNTILQSIVDEDKRSRVMSYYTMFFIGSAPLGHIGAGWLAEAIGAPRTFLVLGCAALGSGALFLAGLRSFRETLRPIYVRRGIIPASPDTPPS